MVIDTSAVIAVLFAEQEAEAFAEAIENDQTRLISAATVLETSIVIEARKGESGGRELDLMIHRGKFEIVPVSEEQQEVARIAWRQFGKGNHKAKLNYGDLFSYALSKVSGEPLLFKGNDFTHTDITGCEIAHV